MREWLYPLNYERRYSSFLENSLTQTRREFLARLQTLPYDNAQEIDIVLSQTLDWWKIKRQEKRRYILGYFALINAFNKNQFRAVVKSGTGLTLPQLGILSSSYPELIARFGTEADVFLEEPYLQELQDNWVSIQDTNLDKTVTAITTDASLIVKQGILSALTRKIILDTVGKKFDTASSNIGKFGKDQVSLINTQLERKRAQSLGLNDYEWLTRRDERVRGNPDGLYPKSKPSHWAREGQVFNWNDPPEGGHPGEAPGCRCKARIRFKK